MAAPPSIVLKVLTIGDPHFKADNAAETELLLNQLVTLIPQEQPDVVKVMGDLLDRHERIDLYPQKRAIEFLRQIRQLAPETTVLIGNHDRPNNRIYLTDEHCLTFLREWDRVTLVDRVQIATLTGKDGYSYQLVDVPYVPTGRFEEALGTVGLKAPYTGISAFFAHQEFRGAKMGAITSTGGDLWDPTHPLCVSGHIHDYDQLQGNLIYPGTPLQHGFGDTREKTVSLFSFVRDVDRSTEEIGVLKLEEHRRIPIQIPKKLRITLTVEELATYVPPPGATVQIKVEGSAAMIREALQLPQVKALAATPGIKIKEVPLLQLITPSVLAPKVKSSFADRLTTAISQQSAELQQVYAHVFGGK